MPSGLRSALAQHGRTTAVLLVAALLGAGTSWGITHVLRDDREAILVVDAQIDAGAAFEIFFNERWDAPMRVPIQPGVRTVYTFAHLPTRLWQLRLDPTDVPNTHLRLFGATLIRDGEPDETFNPAAMRAWDTGQFESTPAGDDTVYEGVSQGIDPILLVPGTHGPVTPARGAALPEPLQNLAVSHGWVLAILLGLLTIAADRRRSLLGVYVPVALVLFIPVQGWFAMRLRPLLASFQASDVAVGWANFMGYPKAAEHRVVIVSTLLMMAVGWLGARWLRPRLAPLGMVEAGEAASGAPSGRLAQRLASVVLGFIALVSVGVRVPHVAGRLAGLQHVQSVNYDEVNIFTWQYSAHEAWLPMRDFWYPYGGLIGFDTFWGGGAVEAFFHGILLLAVFAACIYVLTERSKVWTAVMLAAALLTVDVGIEARYAQALDLVLLGLVCRRLGWGRRPAVLLGAFAGYCLIFEPHQVIYGAAAVGAVWALDYLWPTSTLSRRQLGRGVLAAAGTFAGCAVVRTIVLLAQGRLGGQVELLRQSGAMATYCALSAPLADWYRWGMAPAPLLFCGMLFFLGYGAFLRTLRRDATWERFGTVYLSVGLLLALCIHKQVVRPHMAGQLIQYVEVGAIILLSQLFGRLRTRARAVVVFGLLFFLTEAGALTTWSNAVTSAQAGFASIPASLSALTDGDTIEQAYAAFYFNAERYPAQKPLIRRMQALLAERPHAWERVASFYMLGDEAQLYVALHQKPPYYITLYNNAPLTAQQDMVRWLDARRPEYVVWRPNFADFDAVPNLVRVPLLYRAVVAGYAFRERVGDYHILQRKPADQPVDLAYWRGTLGDKLDVGALPAHSRLASLPACAPTTPPAACADTLHVHVAAPRAGEPLEVRVNAGTESFAVVLRQQDGVQDYFVHLERVWFWPAMKDLGLQQSLDIVPGATVELARVEGATNILF